MQANGLLLEQTEPKYNLKQSTAEDQGKDFITCQTYYSMRKKI